MVKKILLPVLLLLIAGVCAAEELVNLKYLLRETNSVYSAAWDRDSITVASGDKEVKMMLNYPYVVSGKRIIRVDTPVFVNGANFFLSQATFDTVNVLLSRENPKTVITPVLKAAAAATAVPVKTQVPDEIRIVEEDAAQKKSGSRKKKDGPFVIIIDPGHGGNDPGAIGPGGFQKTAVLDIGLKLREHLKTNKDLKILMTRDKDKFISLKERAEFANRNKADLFISIHCNAARNRSVQGTRSYIYSRTASSREAAEAAKFENSRGGAFDVLLNDLKKGAFEYLSIESAGYIQSSFVKIKVKMAADGARLTCSAASMPSVLVECAFISNRKKKTCR